MHTTIRLYGLRYPSVYYFLLMLMLCTGVNAAGPHDRMTEKGIGEVGWSAAYMGKSYDPGTNTTTFTYVMTAAAWEKDLSHWVLGMNTAEVPESNHANTSYGLDPTTGVYGFKWDNGQAAGTSMTYTLTFHGNISESATVYSVKGGTYFAVGSTTGPGDVIQPPISTFSISGYLYVDASLDGMMSPGEPPVANTTISLFDSSGAYITSVLTGKDGYYRFDGLLNGDYTVRILNNTQSMEDFNERLFDYFTGADHINVATVSNANVIERNFPVMLQAASVMDDIRKDDPDLDGFTFQGTGKTIGYWKHQHRVALTGKGRPHVYKPTLMSYLDSIEALWLGTPFQFNDADEIQHSDNILSSTSSNAVDLLNKQMLGTELNHGAGLGLSNAMALQAVILNWAEYLSANGESFTRETLLMAKDLCDSINNSGE